MACGTRQVEREELFRRASSGDPQAVEQLLDMHRQRLRRMVTVRMDDRLQRRFDASDVVQEALAEAARRLPDFFARRPLPFYPWLRQLAWERLAHFHRRHLHAQRRSVRREVASEMVLSDKSAAELAGQIAGQGSDPGEHAVREEARQQVRAALERLDPRDREVLVLRYLEQLPVADIAAIVGITVAGVKSRQRRALERLRALLQESFGNGST